MSELKEVVRYVRSALDHKCVFVHMTASQLETMLAGLEESQKRVEELEKQILTRMPIVKLAKRLAYQEIEDEENERPRFRMDANGNLTRIEDEDEAS